MHNDIERARSGPAKQLSFMLSSLSLSLMISPLVVDHHVLNQWIAENIALSLLLLLLALPKALSGLGNLPFLRLDLRGRLALS